MIDKAQETARNEAELIRETASNAPTPAANTERIMSGVVIAGGDS